MDLVEYYRLLQSYCLDDRFAPWKKLNFWNQIQSLLHCHYVFPFNHERNIVQLKHERLPALRYTLSHPMFERLCRWLCHVQVLRRSCGKVMFLHLSVILFTGGVSAPVHAGIHPPWADTAPVQTPPAQCMLGYTWLLLRTVRILLECILVYVMKFLSKFQILQPSWDTLPRDKVKGFLIQKCGGKINQTLAKYVNEESIPKTKVAQHHLKHISVLKSFEI